MKLVVDCLSYIRAGRCLFDGLGFSLEPGEILSIIGPNGAGKSTLLKLIHGELAATDGNIYFGREQRLTDLWSSELRARSLAVLPQVSPLNFPFTVEEVVSLGRIPHRSGTLEDSYIVDEVLNALYLSDLRYRLYTHLSGGEKQRVQIARVMAQVWRKQDTDERLLLLDEPMSSLDVRFKSCLIGLLQRMANDGITIVIVIHDFNDSVKFTDKVLLMGEGCHFFGSCEQVYTKEILTQVFDVDINVILHPTDGYPLVFVR